MLTVGILLINQNFILCIQLVVRTIQVFLETWDDLHLHLNTSLSSQPWCLCSQPALPAPPVPAGHTLCSHRDVGLSLERSFRISKCSHEPSTTTLVTTEPRPGATSMGFTHSQGWGLHQCPGKGILERIWGRQEGSQTPGRQSQEIPRQRG